MKASQQNLECADVILERHRLPPDPWRDLRRDIALTIDMAEQAAASNMKDELIKRVRAKVSALHNQREELPREHKWKFNEAIIAVHSLAAELEAVGITND